MSLAQQITFQSSEPSSTPIRHDDTDACHKGSRRSSNQVPHYIHEPPCTGTGTTYRFNTYNYLTTNHATMPPSKRLITTGDTSSRPLKQQRTEQPASFERPRSETQTTNQSASRRRSTQRQFKAYKHRTVCREHHEVRYGRVVDGLQGDMGPRTSQEETSRNPETIEGPLTSTRLYVSTTTGGGQESTNYTKRQRVPPQQKQVTTTRDYTQTHPEPLPSTPQAHTQQLPSTSESVPSTYRTSQSPVPPRQPRRAPPSEGHHDTAFLTTKSPDPPITTEDHALHQHAEPVRQVLFNDSPRPESPPLSSSVTPGKLQRLAANIKNLGVNNISSYSPTNDELVVLALGLNYIPESKDISNIEILQAFDEFSDSLLEREKPKQHERSFSTDPVDILRRKL